MMIFTEVKRSIYVSSFLQHLNIQQPSIRFTIEFKKDNTLIPFLNRSVTRDSNKNDS